MVKFQGKYLCSWTLKIISKRFFYRLHESGILHQWHQHIEFHYGKNFRTYKHATNSVNLKEIQSLVLDNIVSAFYFLLAGLFISFLVFIIEICMKYKKIPLLNMI